MGSDLGHNKMKHSFREKSSLLMAAASFAAGVVFTSCCWLLLLLLMTNEEGNIWSSLCSISSVSNGNHDNSNDHDHCEVYMGKYHGPEYRSSSTIGQPKCLVESKFLKVQQHKVRMSSSTGGEVKTTIIDDWLFIDYHDRINCLVQAPPISSASQAANQQEEPHFYVFQQTKYALEDRMSLAIVGGIIEPHETPQDAVQREVREEMHLTCHDFHFLGRYRTDVNRGGGWTSTYLARNCHPVTALDNNQKGKIAADEVGAADTERQDLQRMSMTEVKKAVAEGKFLEIQWSATVALAMLHESLIT